MRGFWAASAVALTLGGCASGEALQYVMREYQGVTVQTHVTPEDQYRIFDKPEQSRLMITPSLGKAAAGGLVAGSTLGLVDANASLTKPMTIAAESYLASTGRQCRVIATELLVKPQYEVKYDCSAPPPMPRNKRS